MEIKVATDDHKSHFLEPRWVDQKTALVALENNEVVGCFAYRMISHQQIDIVEMKVIDASTLTLFLEELCYWHPYVRQCILREDKDIAVNQSLLIEAQFVLKTDWVYENNNALEVFQIPLDQIVPEQLSVDITKVEKASQWIKVPEDVVVALVAGKEGFLCIDGYSRLMVALEQSFPYVYGYLDDCEDISFYEACRSWCVEDGIICLDDVSIVSKEEHQRRWIDRCQAYLKARSCL